MSGPVSSRSTDDPSSPSGPPYDPHPSSTTTAAFSPKTNSGYSASAKQRSTVIVHKKSPLLVATPPQITRALAHSHAFLLPLNKLVALLSWSTDDEWESFLLLAAFWAIVLYGGYVLKYGGPIILVTFLILGMYSRRYSPLSSTSKTGDKHREQRQEGHKRNKSETTPQHKSLDEIVETLQDFTARCNILLEPFLALTDFLSTQTTATTATTRPALTTLFIRILMVTPFWIFLTLPPFYILTARRILLLVGTTILSWHSRPAKIVRVILWRSVFLRRLLSLSTGLTFTTAPADKTSLLNPPLPPRRKSQLRLASEVATKNRSPGVRFTFILYENQRRWIGLGWTTSLFAGERTPWTDEHLNPALSKDDFELPTVAGGIAKWRWLDGSPWQIDGGDAKRHKRASSKDSTTTDSEETDGGGWIYYDNKWDTGRKEDGWGRYCRRRKWYRDAELVEITPSTENSPAVTRTHSDDDEPPTVKVKKAQAYAASLKTPPHDSMADSTATLRPSFTPSRTQSSQATPTLSNLAHTPSSYTTMSETDTANTSALSSKDKEAKKRRSGWFNRNRSDSKSSSSKNTGLSERSGYSKDSKEEDVHDRWRDIDRAGGGRMGFGEDLDMGLS